MEPQSGKSVVALGLMELLSARVERLGFFRPIVPSADEPDPQIELIRRRYQVDASDEQMHALSQDEAAAIPAYEELRKRVVEAYKQLEQGCDFVLCEGTDFTSATSALDYGLNADLANELGAPVLVVVKGGTTEETVASVRAARNSLAHKGCTIFGVVVNRVPPERVEELSRTLGAQDGSEPVYVLPELPELAFPTVGEIADELGAEILSDSTEEALQRDVRDVRVAAMSVEHFIDDLVDGTLVVVPGDRPDILVASLASTVSPAIPTVAGVLVTGGYPLSETVRRLLESAPFPVLNAEQPLHVAANVVQSVRPVIRAENERKIATALGVFESAVDTAELGQRIALERPPRMTPIMFEYELIERAKADRKHIVLPEGDDERVLRAAEILLRRGVVDLTILGDPKDVAARAGVREPVPRATEVAGDDGGARARRRRGADLLRDDAGRPRGRRRHGLGCSPHDRGHDPAGVRDHQVPRRRVRRLQRVLHVPRRRRPRLRRLRRQSAARRRPARRHRDQLGRDGTDVRDRAPDRHALLRNRDIWEGPERDRKSTRLNSSHVRTSYAVFCLQKKKHHRSVLRKMQIHTQSIHSIQRPTLA